MSATILHSLTTSTPLESVADARFLSPITLRRNGCDMFLRGFCLNSAFRLSVTPDVERHCECRRRNISRFVPSFLSPLYPHVLHKQVRGRGSFPNQTKRV